MANYDTFVEYKDALRKGSNHTTFQKYSIEVIQVTVYVCACMCVHVCVTVIKSKRYTMAVLYSVMDFRKLNDNSHHTQP